MVQPSVSGHQLSDQLEVPTRLMALPLLLFICGWDRGLWQAWRYTLLIVSAGTGARVGGTAMLAELGCTEHKIMAITGHQASKEVTRYTKAAAPEDHRKKRNGQTLNRQNGNKSVPLLTRHEKWDIFSP